MKILHEKIIHIQLKKKKNSEKYWFTISWKTVTKR